MLPQRHTFGCKAATTHADPLSIDPPVHRRVVSHRTQRRAVTTVALTVVDTVVLIFIGTVVMIVIGTVVMIVVPVIKATG